MRIWSTSLLYAIMMTGTASKADLAGTTPDHAPPASLEAAQPGAVEASAIQAVPPPVAEAKGAAA